jgi:hypothetical protein
MQTHQEENRMRQIKLTYNEDEANKTVIQIMSRQSKVVAMRPFVIVDGEAETVGIAIEYEEN